ncbi:MAG: hypothetical protein Q8M31_14240 [Beijerinckiaceae bacterium]|nr:hypothetical protein [Beijerinckiaceae bacterium]
MLELLALRGARSTGVAVVTLGLAASSLLAGVQSADAQGLFEALFGRRDAHFAPALTIPYDSRRGVAADYPHKRSPVVRRSQLQRSESSKPAPYQAPEVLPGPLGQFLKDPTLKRGDVVVTSEGVMVFRGSGGSRHHAKDFVSIQKAAQLMPRHTRAELAKVEVAARPSPAVSLPPTRFVESRSHIVAQDDGAGFP